MNKIVRVVAKIIAVIAQWLVCALFFVLTAASAGGAFKFHAVKLDIVNFAVAVAAMAAVTVLLSPPVFFRFGAKMRIASYVLLLPAFVAWGSTYPALNEAYGRTPQGVAEAKAEAAADASRAEREHQEEVRAGQEKRRQEDLSNVEENLRDLAAAQQKVQGCIDFRGQVPALVRHVKDSLHNPRSFQHVHTEMKRRVGNPVPGFPMIVMEYRAENGFGAIRTDVITAMIVPSDCSVAAVAEYDPDDFQVD